MRTRILIASVAIAVDVAGIAVAIAAHNTSALVAFSIAIVAGYNYLARTRRARKGRQP